MFSADVIHTMGKIEWEEWDTYFLGIADAVSQKSKDTTKVGAVITTRDHLIVSTGFNGMPRHVSSTFEEEVVEDQDEKLLWMVHAEANAVINAARTGNATPGCFLYVNKFPCYGCLQAIIQAGITRIYTDDKAYWRNDRQDPDHDGKKYLIDSAKLEVVAPNHSDYKGAAPPRLSKSKPPPRNSEPPPSHH